MNMKTQKTHTPGIVGKKLGMTSLFAEDGARVNVTVVEAGPCTVVAKRTQDKNGYDAIQLGFGVVEAFRANKPAVGHFKKAGQAPARHLAEIRLPTKGSEGYEVGQIIKCDLFKPGELVDVTGTSKGKGFQGVMKKYHFAGFKSTHGTHEYRRHPGGISAREQPGKVWKNKRLPGQMGNDRVTVQNLKVFQVRPEENLLLLEGAVPGSIGGLVRIHKAIKDAIFSRKHGMDRRAKAAQSQAGKKAAKKDDKKAEKKPAEKKPEKK